MTDAQLLKAAIKLCELRGMDPDQMVAHGADPDHNGFVHDVLLYSPAWRRAAREIVAADQMQQALEAGRQPSPDAGLTYTPTAAS